MPPCRRIACLVPSPQTPISQTLDTAYHKSSGGMVSPLAYPGNSFNPFIKDEASGPLSSEWQQPSAAQKEAAWFIEDEHETQQTYLINALLIERLQTLKLDVASAWPSRAVLSLIKPADKSHARVHTTAVSQQPSLLSSHMPNLSTYARDMVSRWRQYSQSMLWCRVFFLVFGQSEPVMRIRLDSSFVSSQPQGRHDISSDHVKCTEIRRYSHAELVGFMVASSSDHSNIKLLCAACLHFLSISPFLFTYGQAHSFLVELIRHNWV